ncbi:MAG: transposase [Opitutales bacterium]|nr:transposase [Opitutales bacterium]
MGEIRIKAEQCGVYHVTSRIIHRRRLLGDAEREVWVSALRKAAEFSGAEVITYCVLQNHFHILVRVDKAAKGCDDAEFVRRYRALYGTARAQWSGLDADELAHALARGPVETAEALRERLRARMGDISEFMRTLRQRYTKWYNRTHETVGTLWSERFGSVLVEDVPWVVGLVAAYIDLNAVRAGLAKLPEDYRWTGYAAALAGAGDLREALARCFPGKGGETGALARYRLLMLGKGAAARRGGGGGRIAPEDHIEAVRAGGELRPHELLRLRARFFSRARVLGSRAWSERGGGCRALEAMGKSGGGTPVKILKDYDLAVGSRRLRAGGLSRPDD